MSKRKCPNCQSTNHAKILWGLPADMRKIEESLKKNEMVLGGCDITDGTSFWRCNDCFTRF